MKIPGSGYEVNMENNNEVSTVENRKKDEEVAKHTIKIGKLSVEEIVQCVPSLTLEDVERIQQELLQSV